MNLNKHTLKFIAFVLITVLVSWDIANAQTPNWAWAKSFGGSQMDFANDVIADSSGNVFTTGIFYGTADFDPGPGTFNLNASAPNGSFFLTKMDAAGDFLWAKQWPNGVYYYPFTLNIDADENLYMTGYFTGTVDFDPGPGTVSLSATSSLQYFLLKLTNDGNFLWVKPIGGVFNTPLCYSTIDVTGNIYTAGFFTGTFDFNPGAGVFNMTSVARDLFVVKLDAIGNFIWAKKSTGNNNTWVNDIAVDDSGSVFVTGSFSGTTDFDPGPGFDTLNAGTATASEDIYILKLTSSGLLDWVVQFGSPGTGLERPEAIEIDATGNVYTTGHYYGSVDFDPGPGTHVLSNSSTFISKLDNNGNFIDAIAFDLSIGRILSLTLDGNSNIYFSGVFLDTTDMDPGPGVYNIIPDSLGVGLFIAALDSATNFLWAAATGGNFHFGSNNDRAVSVYVDKADNIYVCGSFEDRHITFGTDTLFNSNQVAVDITDVFVVKIGNNITGVHEVFDLIQSGLFVYPNPSTGIFTLQSIVPLTSLEIYNATGQLVSQQLIPSQTEFTFDLTEFRKGIYIVVARDKSGKSYNKKLLVE